MLAPEGETKQRDRKQFSMYKVSFSTFENSSKPNSVSNTRWGLCESSENVMEQ